MPLANPQLIFIQVLSTCHNWLKIHITPFSQRPLYHVALHCTSKLVWHTLLIMDDPHEQLCKTREGDISCNCYKTSHGGSYLTWYPHQFYSLTLNLVYNVATTSHQPHNLFPSYNYVQCWYENSHNSRKMECNKLQRQLLAMLIQSIGLITSKLIDVSCLR